MPPGAYALEPGLGNAWASRGFDAREGLLPGGSAFGHAYGHQGLGGRKSSDDLPLMSAVGGPSMVLQH
jgi:hypothetical protein